MIQHGKATLITMVGADTIIIIIIIIIIMIAMTMAEAVVGKVMDKRRTFNDSLFIL
jgi:hypothetical protein